MPAARTTPRGEGGKPGRSRFSIRAGLCALGRWVVKNRYLDPLHEKVKVGQKRVSYTPTEKLVDCLIGMLWGIEGMYQINTTVRTERFVSMCFGRGGCAEASTIQDTLQVAIRKLKDGKWKHAVLVSTLCEENAHALLRLYDARGGHPESSFQQDGQGLPLQKRQKRRMAASQMLLGLAQMARNVLVWAKRQTQEKRKTHIGTWGLERWVRDLLSIPGSVARKGDGFEITLSASHPLSRRFIDGFGPLLRGSQTRLSLGEI